MPAFIRYPFFGCVILALSACGSSGSSRLLEPEAPPMETPVSTVQEAYSSVNYLITDIPAAIAKFAATSDEDMEDMEGMEGMEGMDEDEEEQAPTDPGATALGSTPAALDSLRNLIIGASSRYLSTGTVLARTDGSVMREHREATCADATGTGPAKCDFPMDTLREATTFHLGSPSSTDENRVSFRSFMADRQPVMTYRQTLMSQVRTIPAQDPSREIYEDANGNEYLLTRDNITNMELTDETGLPTGITLDTAPGFADLFAVYEDEDENKYLLTPDNVANMNLEDVDLPTGVMTAPEFASLSKARESQEGGREEYVGYDGMLQYSMFFVGVHRFFDEEDELQHVRFEHASLGRIYDEDAVESGIQQPSVALTGEGVMVGMEREKRTLDSHLVQGDVEINYSYDDMTTPDDMTDDSAMIDLLRITNIQRLADDRDAWYAGNTYSTALTWRRQPVMNSKFSHDQTSTVTAEPGTLRGSFYGTKDNPEVGGVFHHESPVHEIIGSFGSRLSPVEDDDDDMMDP